MFVRQMHTSILLHICCIYIKVQNPILYSQVMAWHGSEEILWLLVFLQTRNQSIKLETRFVFGMFLVDLQSFWSPLVTLFFPFVAGSQSFNG
jgi:hypothetical protein